MKRKPFNTYFQALPPYLGGKRKLVRWIFNRLSKAIPVSGWENSTFLDAFSGGGTVSLYAKAQGFQSVYSNDWSERSQFIIEGLLSNQDIHLTEYDKLKLVTPLLSEIPPGYIQKQFCPSVFSERHSKALDRFFFNAEQFTCPIKKALAILVGWRLICEFICIPTSIGSSNRPFAEVLDGLRDWQELNPKRFSDGSFSRLLKPTWSKLDKIIKATNYGVFRGSTVHGSKLDAFEFISKAQGDILYLDPPYPNTSNYEASNRTLDSILLNHSLETKKSTSLFSKGVNALESLLDASLHVPVWALSYGNAVLSLEELTTLVQRAAPKRKIIAEARSYKHMAHVSKNDNNQELLIIAYQ